jgi:hypothetical protein
LGIPLDLDVVRVAAVGELQDPAVVFGSVPSSVSGSVSLWSFR